MIAMIGFYGNALVRVAFALLVATAWVGSMEVYAQGSAQLGGSQEEGIVVYRERDVQDDEFAPAVRFKSYVRYPSVFHFDIGTGTPMILANYLVAAVITVQDFGVCNLVDDADRARLEAYKVKMQGWAKHYQKAAPLIRSKIDELDGYLKQLNSGMVRYNKQWITREAYQANEAAHHREIEAMDRERMQRNELARSAASRLVQLDQNLTTAKTVTLGGHYLLSRFNDFYNLAVDYHNGGGFKNQVRMCLPDNIIQGALPLPGIDVNNVQTAEVGLREGVSPGAPAVLFIKDEKGVLSLRLAIALKMDGDSIANTSDLQAAARLLTTVNSELADWLPLALVSARAKLEFQRNNQGKAGTARVSTNWVSRPIGGRYCDLMMVAPVVHTDGAFYAMLMISVI